MRNSFQALNSGIDVCHRAAQIELRETVRENRYVLPSLVKGVQHCGHIVRQKRIQLLRTLVKVCTQGIGVGKNRRISDKQAGICERYMQTREAGTIRRTRYILEYEWAGRNVSVDYVRGFPEIWFGPTKEENENYDSRKWYCMIVRHIKEKPWKKAEIISRAIKREEDTIAYFSDDDEPRVIEECHRRIKMLQAL